jgi:hypothetical protein
MPCKNENIKLSQFIHKNKSLFWYINPEKLDNISEYFVVETILNYGNLNDVKELMQIMGLKHMAGVFLNSVNKKRNNYFPDVENYFKLYL